MAGFRDEGFYRSEEERDFWKRQREIDEYCNSKEFKEYRKNFEKEFDKNYPNFYKELGTTREEFKKKQKSAIFN